MGGAGGSNPGGGGVGDGGGRGGANAGGTGGTAGASGAGGASTGVSLDAGRDVSAPSGDARPGDGAPSLPAGSPLNGIGAVETLATFPGATEGTLWIPERKIVLVADRENSVIYAYDPATRMQKVFRANANGTVGHARDKEGRLLSCEQSAGSAASGRPGRSVVRSAGPGIDGEPAVFIETFPGGKGAPAGKFNRPNDIVVRKDGVMYFTDPWYAGTSNEDLGDKFQGVFRASADGKTVVAEAWLRDKPNGIALAPDEKILYVATRSPNVVHRFPINDDGSLGAQGKFADTPNYVDGMTTDDQGNLWACLPQGGIRVYRPDGTLVGSVPGLSSATNLTFGDEDRKTLYIADGRTLKRVRVTVTGAP
jgi:gluconolactonase